MWSCARPRASPILYGLGDPATGRAVLAAHHAGLAEAVAYLDEHLGPPRPAATACPDDGVLAVGFDHRTSREGDPLLHTHLVVANRVQGPDGRWTALDGRDLYRHRLAGRRLPGHLPTRTVRDARVEWTPADITATASSRACPRYSSVSSPSAPIRSMPSWTGLGRTVRSGRHGWSSGPSIPPKPKQHETPGTLYGRWRQEAGERGHDAGHPGPGGDRPDSQPGSGPAVSAAVAGRLFDRLTGPDGLTATASTFTRPDVLVALGAGLAGAGRTELEALVDRFLAERAVSVVADRALEEAPLVHPELLAVEQQLVTSATGRTASTRPWSLTTSCVTP